MLTLHSVCCRNIKKNPAVAAASNLRVNQSEQHIAGKVVVAAIPSKVKHSTHAQIHTHSPLSPFISQGTGHNLINI